MRILQKQFCTTATDSLSSELNMVCMLDLMISFGLKIYPSVLLFLQICHILGVFHQSLFEELSKTQ